jgi:tRNA (mo5U34)-methyltransferase
MIDYSHLFAALEQSAASHWLSTLPADIDKAFNERRHGDVDRWKAIIDTLPQLAASSIDLENGVRIGTPDDISEEQRQRLEQQLRGLHPWRKGPFDIFGIHIDTEWHSDWKWDRIQPHLLDLRGRQILDIGSGNGYFCLRMLGAGASLAIGIDPSKLFTMQFHALKHFLGNIPAYVLPLGIEHLPEKLAAFDTVFSMGVLYHRRSPIDHLYELRGSLRPGGELVLETLVIDGNDGQVLVPENRYAQMRNVWFIPTCSTLVGWMKRCGYKEVRVVDVTHTTLDEQHSTSWMSFDSLPQFLDPDDASKTIEGYPAPRRAVILATAP